MSFKVFDEVSGAPPQPQPAKEGVVSFDYVTGTNDDLSYLQLLGSNTIWVTDLAAAGTDTLNMPSDAQMIALFDPDQVLVGCAKHYRLYVDARCTLAMTSPASIVLPVAGMYDLDLTVISTSAVFVNCQQVSGGPEATSGQYVAPLTRSITAAATITAAQLVPPAGSGELVLVLAGAATLPTAPLLYVALYGTQTFAAGMSMTFKIIGGGGNLTASASITAGAVATLPAPLVANSIYQCTIMFQSATTAKFAGILIGSNA